MMNPTTIRRMLTPLVIFGAGGHGREILDVVNDHNHQYRNSELETFDFLGFIDDGEPDLDRLARVGALHIGPSSTLGDLPPGCKYTIGIGSGAARRQLDGIATAAGLEPATLIHSSATIGADVRVALGVVICAQVSITTNVSIGRHAHINRNCAVGHDVKLLDYSTLNPSCAVSGEVTVGEEAMIGTNAAINQGLSIGHGSVVASGAAVIKDVPQYTLAAGVPAVSKKAL